jgi:hypothetical protein
MFDNENRARFFEERMRDPLDRTFRLLLRTAPRATAERALRAALTVLVASDTRVGHPRFDVAAIPQRRCEWPGGARPRGCCVSCAGIATAQPSSDAETGLALAEIGQGG